MRVALVGEAGLGGGGGRVEDDEVGRGVVGADVGAQGRQGVGGGDVGEGEVAGQGGHVVEEVEVCVGCELSSSSSSSSFYSGGGLQAY